MQKFTIINSKKKLSPLVNYVIESWLKIKQELEEISPSDALQRVFNKYYAEKDKVMAQEFYDTFKSSPEGQNINKNEVIFENFSSIEIFTKQTNYTKISFSFPFQCRQYTDSDILAKILAVIEEKAKTSLSLDESPSIGVTEFLLIWLLARREVIIKLSESDLHLLRYIIHRKIDTQMLINIKEMADYYKFSVGNVSKRIRRMIQQGVLRSQYMHNFAKLGFVTILLKQTESTEEVRKIKEKYHSFRIAEFSLGKDYDEKDNPDIKKERFTIYQLPSEWLESKLNNNNNILYFDSLEFGYSLALLQTKGKIDLNIPLSLKEIFNLKMIELERRNIIDLKTEVVKIDKDDFEILKNYSHANYNLIVKTKELAEKYGISDTSYRSKIRNFMEKEVIYPFFDIAYVGFPKTVVIYASGKKPDICSLKMYLKQYFHYRFYIINDSESDLTNSVVGFIKIAEEQLNELKEVIERNKGRFIQLRLAIIDEKSNFLQKTIDFNIAKYSFDDFFGLRWQEN